MDALAEIKSTLRLLTWMMGTNIALNLAIAGKLFLTH